MFLIQRPLNRAVPPFRCHSFPCTKNVWMGLTTGAVSVLAPPLAALTLAQLPLPKPTPPTEPLGPQPLPTPLQIPPVNLPVPQVPNIDTEDPITVKEFRFEGNTVYSDKELGAIVAPYKGKELTFAQLIQVSARVGEFYVRNGYYTSGALVPPAKNKKVPSSAGIVTIQVVEGKVERINLTGGDRLQGYVRDHLERAINPVLNENKLLEALRLLQVDPLVKRIAAEILPGSGPARSVVEVQLEAEKPFSAAVILDNERSPAVGSFQRRLQLDYANPLGLGDKLSATYRNTQGSNAVQASYRLPVNSQNGSIEFAYTFLDSEIIEEPFTQLDILTDYQAYDVTYRQPVFRKASERATQEFALGLTGSRQESDASLLGTPFPISTGADEQGRTDITALRFFQEWTRRGGQEVLFARSQFSLGLDLFDSTINEEGPDSRFFSWRAQAYWLQLLPANLTLRLRGDLQLSDRDLVPVEQVTVGGPTTVRGYRQDLLLGDNGFLAGVELGIPVTSGRYGAFQFVPFFDVGTIFGGNSQITVDTSTLASVGLGLQYIFEERVSARLDYGIPLINIDSSENTWQEQGISFSLQFQQPF